MVLVPHGIRMPAGKVVSSQSLFQEDPIDRPYVVKPVNEARPSVLRLSPRRALRQSDRPRRRRALQHFSELLADPSSRARAYRRSLER